MHCADVHHPWPSVELRSTPSAEGRRKVMFKELNPLLHSELRLAVMSLLISVEEADFVYIRKETGATAGNLSVQIDKLSGAGYVEVTKTFRGKKPCTLCRITPRGVQAFEEYVEALKTYIVK